MNTKTGMKALTITMDNGAVFAVPLETIARHRANARAGAFGGDPERALREETEPLFDTAPAAIVAWAQDHMTWADVEDAVLLVNLPPEPDYAASWRSAAKQVEILDAPGE